MPGAWTAQPRNPGSREGDWARAARRRALMAAAFFSRQRRGRRASVRAGGGSGGASLIRYQQGKGGPDGGRAGNRGSMDPAARAAAVLPCGQWERQRPAGGA